MILILMFELLSRCLGRYIYRYKFSIFTIFKDIKHDYTYCQVKCGFRCGKTIITR